jgi:hypothetical protein
MSAYALPCLVCGAVLRNVLDEVDNQPDGGTACTTEGHYGSTVWDPMNGEFLEFNVCDECLTRAGEQGRVYAARTKRPVYVVDDKGREFMVGWEKAAYRPVRWQVGMANYDDDGLRLDMEELDEPPAGVHLEAEAVAMVKQVNR